jgi:hypothetical protein
MFKIDWKANIKVLDHLPIRCRRDHRDFIVLQAKQIVKTTLSSISQTTKQDLPIHFPDKSFLRRTILRTMAQWYPFYSKHS